MPHVSDSGNTCGHALDLKTCLLSFLKFCGWLAIFLFFPSSISRRYTYYSSNHSSSSGGGNSAAIASNLALKQQQQQQQQRLRLRARKVLCSECRQVKKNIRQFAVCENIFFYSWTFQVCNDRGERVRGRKKTEGGGGGDASLLQRERERKIRRGIRHLLACLFVDGPISRPKFCTQNAGAERCCGVQAPWGPVWLDSAVRLDASLRLAVAVS